MTPADHDLLSKIEQGTSTFRPPGPEVGVDPAFARTMEGLLRLRAAGWINLPDTRIARDRGGRILLIGPCDVTPAGRQALEQGRTPELPGRTD